jgi:small-conductance mechanosensitive channel
MKKLFKLLIFVLFASCSNSTIAQTSSAYDTLSQTDIQLYYNKLDEIEKKLFADSLQRVEIERKINSLDLSEHSNIQYEQFAQEKAKIDSLRAFTKGYPVQGILYDTLFHIYAKFGESTLQERANNISSRIKALYKDDFLKIDSISPLYISSKLAGINYGEVHIMGISEIDAIWAKSSPEVLAKTYTEIIKNSIRIAKAHNSLPKILKRIGLTSLILIGVWLLLWIIGKSYNTARKLIDSNKGKWLKNLSYKDYTFLSAEYEYRVLLFVLKILKWFVIATILYIAIPLLFSIFPFTRGWSKVLFKLMWLPFRSIFMAIWAYLPNLFSILAIYLVMKYLIRFVKLVFSEIRDEKLNLSGFHADWAMPTYGVVRFILYAFMFVVIFPFLPGSDSDIFKGVSVFLGILFSLGSSNAIANMVAGLVITYMRPFKIGDRIKIGEITGDVAEKNLLVTRIITVKNEEITIPNSSILKGNTTNYSVLSKTKGLIIHTTITIGYDVPWKDVHQSLTESALRTEMILIDPKPFVLQTSLDDFYVAYQLNAYINEPNKQSIIYSNLHQHIQDVFNAKGIEILSPHYRAERDGNMTTIPPKE